MYAVAGQYDTVEATDPNFSVTNAAILPFFNSANPQQPLAGPGGTNPPTTSTTERKAIATIGFVTGTNTSTTTAPTLTMPTGAVPLYVGYLNSSDTDLNGAHFWAVGLGAAPTGGGLAGLTAPFLHGLLSQHHLGVVGSAPKIDGGVEWKPLSTVNNNGESLINVNELSIAGPFIATARNTPGGTTAPTIPTVNTTSCNGGTAIIEVNSSDVAGIISITGASTWPTSNTAMLNFVCANGLVPNAVLLFPQDVNSSIQLLMSGTSPEAVGVFAVRNASPAGFTVWFWNGTGGTFTPLLNAGKWAYLCIF